MLKRNPGRPTGKAPQKCLPPGCTLPTTTLPTFQIENLVKKCVEAGKKYDEAMAMLEAERLDRQELETQLRKQSSAHDVQYLDSALQAAEQELHELESKDKVQTALLALYQSKLKNVTDMFRYYELAENESKIRNSQLQRDLESMESLVADQKLSIETIEKSSIRASAMLQQEQQNKQQMQSRVDALQQQLLDRRQDIANLEANARQQEELLRVKDEAYARLEERYAVLQAEVATLRATALPVGSAPTRSSAAALGAAFLGDTTLKQGSKAAAPRAVGALASDSVQSTAAISVAESVADANTSPVRIIYRTESRDPSEAVDLSYGAMFASAESSMLNDTSFQSSVKTTLSKPRVRDAAAGDSRGGPLAADETPSTSQEVNSGLAAGTVKITRPRGTPSDPTWRSALDPTPMKRKSSPRLVPCAAVPGDPLHSVLRGDTVPLESPSVESRDDGPPGPALRRKPAVPPEEPPRPRPSTEPVLEGRQVTHVDKKVTTKRGRIKKEKPPPTDVLAVADHRSGDSKVVSRLGAASSQGLTKSASARAANKGGDRHRTFDAAAETLLSTSINDAGAFSAGPKRGTGKRAEKIRTSVSRGDNSMVRMDTSEVVFSESLFGLIDL